MLQKQSFREMINLNKIHNIHKYEFWIHKWNQTLLSLKALNDAK